MAIFKNENPVLGAKTALTEYSGYGSGNPKAASYKPTTREIIQVPIQAASALSQWVFQAPWKCQVLGAHFNCTTAGAAVTATVEKIMADGVAPAAANGTTIINVLASTVPMNPTANTRANFAPSTAAGSPAILNAGDQLAVFLSGAPTALVGGLLQIEIAQIG